MNQLSLKQNQMIKPISKVNPQRDSLCYPKYGQFGFEEPVGRKHLSTKASAIKKLIFYESTDQPTTPYSYYQKNYQKRYQSPQISRYYSITPKGESDNFSNQSYSLAHRPKHLVAIEPAKQRTLRNQLQQYGNLNYRRRDELNEILNPYNNHKYLLNQQNPEASFMQMQTKGTTNTNDHRKGSPNFLNSLL